MNIYNTILESKAKGKKLFAVLIDPDKYDTLAIEKVVDKCAASAVDFIFVGGSLMTDDVFNDCIKTIKKSSNIPVVIFPGNIMQINKTADAILFLSLISGRNPDMLIGKHVLAAPILRHSGIEVIPTGYMLIESGKLTTAAYISNTVPIPHDKEDIALCTALAGEMLGMKLIFMDAGSGSKYSISCEMIRAVHKNINIPLIVGGGIKSAEKALENCKAGADLIVVGNAIEKEQSLIKEISESIHSL